LQAFLAVAAAWLTTVTVTGLSVTAVGVLAAMVYALSLHWWRNKRIANPAPDAAAPAQMDVDRFAELWEQRVGGKGCVLEGSRLIKPEPIKAGVRYVLQLVPGKQTYSGALGVLEQIIGGLYLLPGQDLIIERHPVLPASSLLLTIVTRSPVAGKIDWPGPSAFDSATGRVALGPHTDGEGTAWWRVYTHNSAWGGYMSGSSGSGKSRMFDSLAMSIAASQTHPTVVMFIDGDEGASSPLLNKHADHTALDENLEQARAILAGALLLMRVRRAENVAYGLEGFTPTTDRPGVLIFIDECHVIFADQECRDMAAEITRRGRKVGVAIVAASQVATMDAFGGAGNGADVLRSSLRSGNTVILRSMSNNTKTVFGVDIDPTQFPDLPGYAYYVAAKGSAARTAPFRGYYLNDDARDYWAPRITWRSLDAGEGNAWGNGYAQRRELTETARLDALQRIEEAKTRRPSTATKPAVRGDGGAGTATAQFPVWTPPTATQPQLTDSQQAVLTAIKTGADTPAAISETASLSLRQVHNLLAELHTTKHVKKPSYGRYAIAA
nr:hypothetical protein [Longispora sp. (in: high G+C Gram-positive bacteria)]